MGNLGPAFYITTLGLAQLSHHNLWTEITQCTIPSRYMLTAMGNSQGFIAAAIMKRAV